MLVLYVKKLERDFQHAPVALEERRMSRKRNLNSKAALVLGAFVGWILFWIALFAISLVTQKVNASQIDVQFEAYKITVELIDAVDPESIKTGEDIIKSCQGVAAQVPKKVMELHGVAIECTCAISGANVGVICDLIE